MVVAANVLTCGQRVARPGRRADRNSQQRSADAQLVGRILGLGVLAKGPAAVILAGGAVGNLGACNIKLARRFPPRAPSRHRTFCVVALPWYLLCAHAIPTSCTSSFFNTISSATSRRCSSTSSHSGSSDRSPFSRSFRGLHSCSPRHKRRLRLWREKSWTNSPGFFVACWAFFPIVFFSFSQSKLPSYILPAVPALWP